jgi:hypothetical protein
MSSVRQLTRAAAALLALCLTHLPGWAAGTEPFKILDSEGFERPMTAYTVDVPQGWPTTGRVAWRKPCSGNDLYETMFTTRSPDGRAGMRLMPGHAVVWNEFRISPQYPADLAAMVRAESEAQRNRERTKFRNSNCHVGRASGTDQILRAVVLKNRPAGVRVVKVQPNEVLRKAIRDTLSAPQPDMRVEFDAVIVDLAWTGDTGPVAERVWLTWYKFVIEPQGVQGLSLVHEFTFVEPLRLIWAPASEAAARFPQLEAIGGSFRIDPVWYRKIAEVRIKINNETIKVRNHMWEIQQKIVQSAWDADAKQHAKFIDMIQSPQQ